MNFQKVRSFLFYLSLFCFFVGLPFIIAFALGYKFNTRNFKFIKTGLIYLKSQPEGARIYLNGKLLDERTPASIYELNPGVYKLMLEIEEYYPWKAEIDIEAGKALRLDKIILFPLRPALEQLSQEKFTYFHVDSEKRVVYYLDLENKVVYKSDLDGGNFEDVASLPEKSEQVNGWKISPDRKKLFVFNSHQIGVVYFDDEKNLDSLDSPILLDYPREKIINVFWHSDSYHLVVLTNKYVQVVESRPGSQAVNLIKLIKADPDGFYDLNEDALYFSDSQKSPEGEFYNNLYKLKLDTDLYLLDVLRKKDE